ncbi:MAG: GNAT family N-acetyltransferase [Crocinitomicaceae bacterium]
MKESFENSSLSEPRLVIPAEWGKLKDIRIRAVTDSPQAFGDTLAETEERTESMWLEWIQNAKIYVIESSDRFVALAIFKQDIDGVWMINGAWTDPAFRQKGLSKKLFEQIFKGAKEFGVTTIELGVNPIQEEAVNFYKSLGFEVVNHHSNERMGDGKEHPQDVMRISLDQT